MPRLPTKRLEYFSFDTAFFSDPKVKIVKARYGSDAGCIGLGRSDFVLAERRMFAKTIIDSDAFLDMPLSTQCLYFHLCMRADDDGFINNPKKIQRMVGCADDDLKLLLAKSFVIPFDSGVCVIKHWRIHNYIRNDRYQETVYQDEKKQLHIKENRAYSLHEGDSDTAGIPDGIPNDYQMETQVRLGKSSIGKGRLVEDRGAGEGAPPPAPEKQIYGEFQNVRLTMQQYESLIQRLGKDKALSYIEQLSGYIASRGKRYTNHYATILNWWRKDGGVSAAETEITHIPCRERTAEEIRNMSVEELIDCADFGGSGSG